MLDMGPIAAGGMRVLVEDEFTRCFQSAEGAPWNWNLYLFPLWLLGIAVLNFVNLLVANACRLWRVSDDTMLQPIKDAMGEVPLFLYLNNADREVVETFTGELPPRTYVHNYFSRLFQLGLTSKKAAVR